MADDEFYDASSEMSAANTSAKDPRAASVRSASPRSDKDVKDAQPDPDAASIVPPSQKSQFMQFLKTVASFTGDLSQLTCPAFLLSGTSLLEYSAHWADHPELFARIATERDPAERMVAVSRWFISTLYGSFHARCKTGTEKKPYNPVLGEQFHCWWPEADVAATDGNSSPFKVTRTTMMCEQVSHHPPVGAFYIENESKNIFLNGHCGQKTRFKTTSIKVEQTGRAILTVYPPPTKDGVDAEPDEYFITLPELVLRGLLTAQLFVELTGKSSITSSTGYQASFEYLPKPWFGGEYHVFKGQITALSLNGASSEEVSPTEGSKAAAKKKKRNAAKLARADIDAAVPLFNMEGKWTTQSTVTHIESGKSRVLFDADAHPMATPHVAPFEEQNELESRRLWQRVTEALDAANYSEATSSKTAIEEAQRAQRKARAAAGDIWLPKYFVFIPDDNANDGGSATESQATSADNLSRSNNALYSSASSTSPGEANATAATRIALRNLSVAAVAGAADQLADSGLWTFTERLPEARRKDVLALAEKLARASLH